MTTRAEKLEAIGAGPTENPHATLLPHLEKLKEKAAELGVHNGIVDHLDECAFLCKRDIKAKESVDRTPRGRPV